MTIKTDQNATQSDGEFLFNILCIDISLSHIYTQF